jgi:hypothetical protein
MCYNAEVSIGTFTVVTIISIYLWIRNNKIDRAIALILFVISLMQLFEYILWINLDCNSINKLITNIIPIYLYLQPILLAFIVWIMNAGWGGNIYPLIIVISGILFPYYSAHVFKSKSQCIKIGECNHLNWNIQTNLFDNSIPLLYRFLIFFYYVSMLYVTATLNNRLLSIILVILWGFSYIIIRALYNEVWPSIWCHSVNVAAIFALFI